MAPTIFMVDEAVHQGENGEVAISAELVEMNEQLQRKLLAPVGYLQRDCFGRVFFDACKTEEEHYKSETSDVPDGKGDRRRCRVYVEDMFTSMVGKKVKLLVTVMMYEEAEQ